MRRMRGGAQTCALLLPLLGAACAAANITPPQVAVDDVRLIGIGVEQSRFAVSLCVTNPNPSALSFRHVTSTIDVAGSPLASGASDEAVVLPAMASTEVPFTFAVTPDHLDNQVMSILRSGQIQYRVHGTVTIAGLLGIPIPYSRAGQMDLLSTGLQLAATDRTVVSSACMAHPAPFQPS